MGIHRDDIRLHGRIIKLVPYKGDTFIFNYRKDSGKPQTYYAEQQSCAQKRVIENFNQLCHASVPLIKG